jgi:hypothetical protein
VQTNRVYLSGAEIATMKWRILSFLVCLLQATGLVISYLSVVAPMAIYQVLQEVASAEGANSAGLLGVRTQ